MSNENFYPDVLNATERCENFNTTVLPMKDRDDLKKLHRVIKDEISGRDAGKQWTIKDFQIGKPLGRGQFGHVYLAREKKTKYIVALKTLAKKKVVERSRMQLQVIREIEIQCHLNHPNILKLLTYFADNKRVYLVLEYAGGGEVFTKLQKFGRSFSERRSAKYTYQVADALEYCHSLDVIHRDIKPENLLLDVNDNIKLADFGWSVHAPSNKRKTKCGTRDYLAPEMVGTKTYSKLVDNWCLGVLCYEFLVGRPPFECDSEKKTFEKILKVDVLYPSYMEDGAVDLISKLLKYKPADRLSFGDVKKHSWLVINKRKFMNHNKRK